MSNLVLLTGEREARGSRSDQTDRRLEGATGDG